MSSINILKMCTLLKITYRFAVIPIKIPKIFSLELEKLMLKFIWKCMRNWVAEAILSNKNKASGVTTPDFRLYYGSAVIKTAWEGHKTRPGDQGNRIEIPDVNPHI